MNKLPKIVIVDDHDIFRDGLSSLITLKGIGEIIGQASNGEELLNMIEKEKPDLILMDIAMPVMDGIKASKSAIEKYSNLNILALTMFGDEDYYIKMINAGAKGFVLKSASKQELESAISIVSKGGSYFSNDLLRKALTKLSTKKNTANTNFTNRELEILELLCKGYSASEIANNLNLSKKTIEGHRTKLFNKTGTKNSVSLVLFAIKEQIVEL